MQLSTRTLMREKAWVKVIRGLAEGENVLPLKMEMNPYNALKMTCFRENLKDKEFNYIPSYRQGKVTINKVRKPYGESSGEQLQSE